MTDEHHCKCKLADFGLVFDLTSPNRSRAIEGDSRYLAPELMQGNCCLANDIYSLGISVLELACNLELPTNGFLWQELRSLILPDIVKTLSPELQQVIRAMMEPDPLKRPTVNQLLNIRKLKELRRQRKMEKISEKFRESFVSSFQYVKSHLLIAIFFLFDFFKLDKTGQKMIATPARQISFRHTVENCDEHSDDDDTSFRTSLNNSHLSKISRASADDDNNNENVTPTLNNSIPRVTPDIKIINSTPLNHHEGLSHRKYRRDLTKSRFVFYFIDCGFI
jgi:membrane-associated tyrosine/threonine-specific cdc2-inhibitory kinase